MTPPTTASGSEWYERERTVSTNGVDLRVVEAGEGHPVILAHGFPELSYSWRHQFPALVAAGYHAVAPDQRGYGRSSRPEPIEDYNVLNLTADLIGVLDDLGEEKAFFVGHDWGSLVVWTLSLLYPERVTGVVGMSVPFMPRPPVPPTETMRQVMGDSFFYILYFQAPGPADENLGRDAATTMRRMLAGAVLPAGGTFDPSALANDGRGFVERIPEPDGLPDWLSQDELDHYSSEFARTGFTGGINWYRNFDRNWELTEHLDGAKVEAPSLFITGERDPVRFMMPEAVMDGWVTDHRGTVIVDGAGHWVQQERPGPVNEALLGFLDAVGKREG